MHINDSRNPLYHETRTEKVNNIADSHRQSNQRLPKAYQLRRTFAAKHNIRNHRIQQKEQSKMTAQGTSTNPTNIMEQTPWPGNHEYKPWPGYNQARLL
jgi:hypothetical protein